MSRDPGLQPERTRLAWSRTAWSAFILALLSLRAGIHDKAWLCLLTGGLLALAAILAVSPLQKGKKQRLAGAVLLSGLLLAFHFISHWP